MALSPELRALVGDASTKYRAEPKRGIIPLDLDHSPHDAAIVAVARMIDRALTGPAIGVYELAEKIVGEVAEILMDE